jgi:outer membrane protein assembly factor BamB
LTGSAFVSLLAEQNRVFAGTKGEVFCLDAATGKLLWHDGLKGYGFGLVSLATKDNCADMAALAAEHEREQSDASSAGGTVVATS